MLKEILKELKENEYDKTAKAADQANKDKKELETKCVKNFYSVLDKLYNEKYEFELPIGNMNAILADVSNPEFLEFYCDDKNGVRYSLQIEGLKKFKIYQTKIETEGNFKDLNSDIQKIIKNIYKTIKKAYDKCPEEIENYQNSGKYL